MAYHYSSNMGGNITAFVASLGVGGIAIALAAQNILGDLFASIAIATDKPFEVGDFITLGSVAGTVGMVGVKTTRIPSLSGEQIVMPNTEMLKQTVSNFKGLKERRIVIGFGVTYDTTAAQAEAIPALVKGIIDASDKLRFERAHFKKLGESSLDSLKKRMAWRWFASASRPFYPLPFTAATGRRNSSSPSRWKRAW